MKRFFRTAACAGLCACAAGCAEKKDEPAAARPDARPLVTVCRVTPGVAFEEKAFVQGTVRTKESASVAARVPGTLEALLVEEGDFVKAGTPLFRTDRVNLANAVRAAKDDLALARAKLLQAEAARKKTALDADRMKRLAAEKAVTSDQAEKADVAAVSQTAAVEAAKAMVTKAETGLAVAEKNLADSEVKAPFDGVVTRRVKESGDYAGPGATVLKMDNTAAYEIRFAMNADDYGRVKPGETEVRLKGRAEPFRVQYRSPSVNPATRTFEVRIAVPKTDDLAPGMIRDAEVVFARTVSDALPASAVNTVNGKDTVCVVKDGRVAALAVEAGAEKDGLRAVKGVPADAAVLKEAMLLVNEGDEVRVSE